MTLLVTGLRDNEPVLDASVQAAFWTLLGALSFSLMNAAAKYLGLLDQQMILQPLEGYEPVPIFQMTFARYAVAALLVLPFMLGRPMRFRISAPRRYLGRTVAGFGGIALMFAAIQTVPLASATAIGFTSPIFAMIFSAILLCERVPRLRWFAASIGFSGAIIIASPGSGVPLAGASIALMAAAFMGAEVVGVKWLARTNDGAVTILFYSNLTGVFISGAFMAPGFVWLTPSQSNALLLIGLMAILGQACIIRAAKMSDANFIAPFFYVSLFYAALIGYTVFGETISLAVGIGCSIILMSAFIGIRIRTGPGL